MVTQTQAIHMLLYMMWATPNEAEHLLILVIKSSFFYILTPVQNILINHQDILQVLKYILLTGHWPSG